LEETMNFQPAIRTACWAIFLIWHSIASTMGAEVPNSVAQIQNPNSPSLLDKLRAVAIGGDQQAAYQLGMIYESGDGVSRDFEEAVRWYRLAADGGYREAQYELGVFQQIGLGTELNLVEALKWLKLSEHGGGSLAIAAEEYIASFISKMSEDQIAEASRRADSWCSKTTAPCNTERVADRVQPAEHLLPPHNIEEHAFSVMAMLDAAINKALSGAKCMDYILRSESNMVILNGIVSNANEIQKPQLESAIAAVKPDLILRLEMTSVGDELCHVAKTFRSFATGDAGVSIRAVKGEAVFRDNEKIAVDVAASGRPGILSVDYFQVDGTVAHLPNATGAYITPIASGETLRLGDTPSGSWGVAPPFGYELLVAVLAPRPLFIQERTGNELGAVYMQSWQQAARTLQSGKDAWLAIDYIVIRTH
jgi:hypothetical protein